MRPREKMKLTFAIMFQVMPMTLNPSIKTLILKYNDFHSVDASFHFYPELTLVDLSSNQLVSVPSRAFTSQRRLQELRLGGNKISELTEKTFSGLSRLQSLDLSHNFLERLENRVFKPLRSVKELNLESNRISEVDQRAFAGCSTLVSLNLEGNLLRKVPTLAFTRHWKTTPAPPPHWPCRDLRPLCPAQVRVRHTGLHFQSVP